MLDKALASVRIGAAEVDTIIEEDVVVPGQRFSGTVIVEGGNVDQEIEGLEHRLVANTPDEDEVSSVTLDSWQVADPFTIEEGDRKEIPFEHVLHPEAPVTELDVKDNKVKVWIDTGLAIDRAVDDSDTDYLRVAPTEAISATVDAMEYLGLDLYRLTADAGHVTANGRDARVGYDQEFEFRATSRYDGPEFGKYQLHLVPWPDQGFTDLLIEVEPSGLLSGSSDIFRSVRIDHERLGVERLADDIRSEFDDIAASL